MGKKKRFLRGNFPAEFPRPKFPQEILARILARILLAEEILKPKISWRREEILPGNFGLVCPTRGGIEFKPTHTTAQYEFLALRPILRGATMGSHVISSSGHSLHPAPIPHTAKPMASGVDDLGTTNCTCGGLVCLAPIARRANPHNSYKGRFVCSARRE